MDGIKHRWEEYARQHPQLARWLREGGVYLIICYLVTFLKYLIMLFLPGLFGTLADNGWSWPGVQVTLFGIPFTFNVIGYSVANGGLAYCIAVWISIIFGECINFPLQRSLTFRNHGPLHKQVPLYAVGVLVVNLLLNAFNSIWVGIAQTLVPDFIYNIVTTVVAGGICMVVFFVIDKIIFAPGFGQRSSMLEAEGGTAEP